MQEYGPLNAIKFQELGPWNATKLQELGPWNATKLQELGPWNGYNNGTSLVYDHFNEVNSL